MEDPDFKVGFRQTEKFVMKATCVAFLGYFLGIISHTALKSAWEMIIAFVGI